MRSCAHALMQGQGMYNVGGQTLVWYSHWSGPLVNLATWKRDRLGYLAPETKSATILSCPVKIVQGAAKVYVNAQVPPGAKLSFSVLGDGNRPVAGLETATFTGDSLHQQLVWSGRETLTESAGTMRIKISGTGDWKLYALYIGEGEPKFINHSP